MSEKDFRIVCSKINEEKEFLNSISQEIWKTPELKFKEVHAHAVLTNALNRHGFLVQEHYCMQTAFRAEYSSREGGLTIAVLLEYDALPEIGHACGHNLISEAGLAAALGIKAAMDADSELIGKITVLGTPAEEGGAGKQLLLDQGAFEGVDVALMVHPTSCDVLTPKVLCRIQCFIEFRGMEAHAAAYPWEGLNALDAAVACYNNISLLRQQIKPSCRIHGIITKGGTATNIIPAVTSMEYSIRAPTMGLLKDLQSRVKSCIESAATATGCQTTIHFDKSLLYENLITNKILASFYQTYAERLGVDFEKDADVPVGSTDMGNVSHAVPSIHPLFGINTSFKNHTKEFAEASVSPQAQEPTLIAGKAMALTALKLMRTPEILDDIKAQFLSDITADLESN